MRPCQGAPPANQLHAASHTPISDVVYILGCRHSPLVHYCWWNKYVANPIKKYGYVGCGRQAMRLLKTEILEKTLLRRTKVQCADVLALPPRSASQSSLLKSFSHLDHFVIVQTWSVPA